jgi:hypothetical protein
MLRIEVNKTLAISKTTSVCQLLGSSLTDVGCPLNGAKGIPVRFLASSILIPSLNQNEQESLFRHLLPDHRCCGTKIAAGSCFFRKDLFVSLTFVGAAWLGYRKEYLITSRMRLSSHLHRYARCRPVFHFFFGGSFPPI